MKIADALTGVTRLYIDTAPLIYFIERHAPYLTVMRDVLSQVKAGQIMAFTSVITLCEVLTQPIRAKRPDLEAAYRHILGSSGEFYLIPVSEQIAAQAARLRAAYNLRTPDALQVATALDAACDSFLTNDLTLRRITEIPVIVLHDLA